MYAPRSQAQNIYIWWAHFCGNVESSPAASSSLPHALTSVPPPLCLRLRLPDIKPLETAGEPSCVPATRHPPFRAG